MVPAGDGDDGDDGERKVTLAEMRRWVGTLISKYTRVTSVDVKLEYLYVIYIHIYTHKHKFESSHHNK